jgi:hypothetical protein
MRRSVILGGMLLLVCGAARANSALWFDPDLGCGRAEVFAQTAKIADLPGCSGTLPAKAPEIERLLHDAKRALVDLEGLLAANKLDAADRLLEDLRLRFSRTPAPNPELPDRWAKSQPAFEKAIADMTARRRMAPRWERLAGAYNAAMARAQAMTETERDDGPAETVRLAKECIAEFAEARAAGIDLSVEGELVPGKRRRLDEGLAECEKARDRAEPLARAEEQAKVARRAEWRKKLSGDRLKIFDQHPGVLPDPGTKKRDAKACAKASVWSYPSSTGNEVFVFHGAKLHAHKVVPFAKQKP